MESRGAKEARLVAKREARERATSERQRIEAVHRECSESLRRDEKERVMRMRRVDSIIVANSESMNNLSCMMTTTATNAGGDQATTEGEPKHSRTAAVLSQNGLSNDHPKFTSILLQPLIGGRSRFSGHPVVSTAASSTHAGDVSSGARLPGLTGWLCVYGDCIVFGLVVGPGAVLETAPEPAINTAKARPK
ncbi:unnamed protein product [Mesocestoides corti]|uniref:Uncharacterized protein n=1 Tax=Mesocestoides corti TaxID=53468 RepID=A0A0R3URL2_MESCO|nr:unnamed protein product [Mesocestoides corti]